MRKLNIIITSSQLPSHPSTEHLDGVIKSFELLDLPKDTKIILANDKCVVDNYSDGYLKYIDIVKKKYKDYVVISSEYNKGLTGNIRNAFNYVDSKYVLIVQHDLPFIKKIDFNKIIEDMDKNNNLLHVRFNKRQNGETDCDSITKGCVVNLYGNLIINNYTYISTPCWSDNNHITSVEYYKNIIFKKCRDNVFMEAIIFRDLRKVYDKNIKSEIINSHKIYGSYIFGDVNDSAVIKHTDGYPKR